MSPIPQNEPFIEDFTNKCTTGTEKVYNRYIYKKVPLHGQKEGRKIPTQKSTEVQK